MAIPKLTIAFVLSSLAACSSAGVCRNNEGPNLQTACAAWDNGRYADLPKMCGLYPQIDNGTWSWADSDGTCKCSVSREFATMFYDVDNCAFAGPGGGSGGGAGGGGGGGSGGGSGGGGGSNGCVDIPVPGRANLDLVAGLGSAPAPAGGVLPDGYYVATSSSEFGSRSAAGAVIGSFGGDLEVASPSFEMAYASSIIQGIYYSSGTFSIAGDTVNLSNSCSSTGPGTTSLQYSVTGPTTVDITMQDQGSSAVITYTRQ